jgi:aryl-alcohol dehydrogenase-like predicted oxidoreductase
VTPATTATRRLGRSGIETSALGIGTWVLGGPFSMQGRPVGWGEVDDEESVRVLRRAADLGVTLVDTADVYGTGHAERVVARALGERRDDLVYATKWGNTYEEDARELTGRDPTPAYARRALEASLRRLGTDRVDVWQLHPGDLDPGLADDLVALCEDLVDEGLIRTYGWSTDDPARAGRFAAGPRCSVVQCTLNVFEPASAMLATAREHDLAVLARSPLAMGLLSDRVTADTRLAPGDVRRTSPDWLVWFRDGRPTPEYLARRDAVRDVLTSGGRTVAQGALAWLWAHDERVVPIPGCRTVAQAEENAGALAHGPLTPGQAAEVEHLLGRVAP